MKTPDTPESKWNFEHNFIVLQALFFCQNSIKYYKPLVSSKGYGWLF